MSATVRIRQDSYELLRELAEIRDQRLQDVLGVAIERLWRDALLEETNRAFAALRADPKAWKAELAERKLWEATLGDGLDD